MDFLADTDPATSSIFSFGQVEELFRLSSPDPFKQQEDVVFSSLLQDGMHGAGSGGDPVVLPCPRQGKQRLLKGLIASETKRNPNGGGGGAAAAAPDSRSDKKVIHREIERLRRQEMASLYGSIRSHLPLQFLKGKRSISDHILETVNYIRHLRSGIQMLSEKRDELKRKMEPKGNQAEPSEVLCDSRDIVMISPCVEGVEVMVSTHCGEGIPPSRILQAMLRGGLDVTSFNSVRINERVVYSIRAEVAK
ncbi:hypothetical protein MLD38_027812 [Melastoma candidum]|uniref:Uncharacterized protein n=1 Tax=Melastoma candidum TaxID=119954 RepID=A0ACB9P4K3_9MYRT|nr:hypothetical protein MLD38_027812 [Melastoma candidum]